MGLVQERLTVEDDPALWGQVLRTLAEDASTLEAVIDGSPLYAEVGICSHWLRPHKRRWTAAGGFAYPIGYGRLPHLDWAVKLLFDPIAAEWVVPAHLPKKLSNSIRVSVPARTARHRQAAVHTVWPRGTLDASHDRTVLYGFRKIDGGWELAANSWKQ